MHYKGEQKESVITFWKIDDHYKGEQKESVITFWKIDDRICYSRILNSKIIEKMCIS